MVCIKDDMSSCFVCLSNASSLYVCICEANTHAIMSSPSLTFKLMYNKAKYIRHKYYC